MTEGNAIVVRGAYKRYNPKAVVLQGLDMTVAVGSVYGFLGPSGCGKTTLLSCIVGRMQLDAGTIQLNVTTRGEIGYMPQELALFEEISIMETIAYFAALHGITGKSLEKRKEELYTFLELPDENSLICNCSGGQRRRVSLCVALLHNPELLILDEPTVGVDPVLSQTIWKHLLMLSSVYKKTIVITTHYIEEARQAHRIGLMRGGIILDEDSPNQLMSRHHCDTLEEAFLLLSRKQSDQQGEEKVPIDYPKPPKKPPSPIKDTSLVSWNHIKSHLIKSYYWLLRNKGIVVFLLFLPIVQCILVDLTLGRDPVGLKLGIVNEELQEPISTCYQIKNKNCSSDFPLSCSYISELNSRKLNLIEYPNVEEAKTGVVKNHVWGFLHFTKNYSDALMERIEYNLGTSEKSAADSEVNVWMDMSNQYIGNLIRKDLYFSFIDFIQNVYKDCDWPVPAARIPIHYETAIYGHNEPSFSDFAVPAVLQLFEFYLPMMFTVGAILMEKRQGILERGFISGMTLVEMLIGHSIVQFIVLGIQTLCMMIILYVFCGNSLNGNLIEALCLLFLVGVSGMCYGFLVSTLCDSDTAATYMGLGSFFPLAMLSGMVWPFEGMHFLLQSVGWFLPLTMTTDAYRAISIRAWGITHPVVYAGFFSSIGWTLFFCLATSFVIKMKHGIRAGAK